MIKVTVRTPETNFKVQTSTSPIQIGSRIQNSIAGGRLDTLSDVVEQSPANNSTLVYNAETDKYIVKRLDLDDVIDTLDDLDGGQF
jgi:hypothetical protein